MNILNLVTNENQDEWLEEFKKQNEMQGMEVEIEYGEVQVFNTNTLAYEEKKGYTITIKQQRENT